MREYKEWLGKRQRSKFCPMDVTQEYMFCSAFNRIKNKWYTLPRDVYVYLKYNGLWDKEGQTRLSENEALVHIDKNTLNDLPENLKLVVKDNIYRSWEQTKCSPKENVPIDDYLKIMGNE